LAYNKSSICFSTRSGELIVQKNTSMLQLNFPVCPGQLTTAPENLIRALNCQPVGTLKAADWFVVLATEQNILDLQPDMELLK